MKVLFPGYYQPSKQEFKQLWEKCLFSFDANILLHLYRFTPATRERFIEIINKLENRLYITHQAAYEYQKNRLDVIFTQQNAYQKIEELLDKWINQLTNELGKYKRHPYIDRQEIINDLENSITRIKSRLKHYKQQHPNLQEFDEIRNSLENLLSGKIGKNTSEGELKKIYQQGSERFRLEIPPGFKNEEKKEPDKYGDFVIWYQLIEHSKEEQKPVIFVTDEVGEDWWLIKMGRTISPRPELIQEFIDKTQQKFYMYSSDQFIEYATQFLALSPQQEAVDEARKIRLESENNALQEQTVNNLEGISINNKSHVKCPRCNSKADIITNEGVFGGQYAHIWRLVCSSCGVQKVLQYEALDSY